MPRICIASYPCRIAFHFALFAQRDLGTITGTITDASNASVANAKVTIVEDATGLKYNVITGSGGEYSRPALKPGVYSVEVEAADLSAPLSER